MRSANARKSDRFPWRFLFYLVVFLYLAGDLYVFEGPIRKAISARKFAGLENAPAKSEWIAIVNREPLTKRQLEVAVMEHLFRRGKSIDELSPVNQRLTKLAVLQELVNNTLIRQYANGANFEVTSKDVDSFITSFEEQFANSQELESRSAAQKLTAGERRKALANVVKQKLWIEQRIKAATIVTDVEARAWFDANHKNGAGFTNPEVFHASHIFISTVIDSSPAREALIRSVHTQLTSDGADFAKIAAQVSEDERTKKRGGDLNWFTKERVPADFYEEVSKLSPGQISAPFRTKIGWHIVKMEDRRPAQALDYETLKPEIVAHLKSTYRAAAVQDLLMRYRKVAAIEVFPERF